MLENIVIKGAKENNLKNGKIGIKITLKTTVKNNAGNRKINNRRSHNSPRVHNQKNHNNQKSNSNPGLVVIENQGKINWIKIGKKINRFL